MNNEVSVDVDDVSLKVEIQTANSKILLAEFGETNRRLKAGGSLESVANHEIKELGQHVLACSVTYRLPPGARGVPGAAEEPDDPGLQTFRKFYKFVVSAIAKVLFIYLTLLAGHQPPFSQNQSPHPKGAVCLG